MSARGPFMAVNGPLYRTPGPDAVFGFLPEERHCNTLGFVHGGMLATLLDTALATSIFERERSRLVTLDLSVSFRSAVPKGRWCEIRVSIGERLGDEVEGEATLWCRSQVCAAATARFKVFPT
jgi:acyl-coenzyme A thioesterase PaaI-like protein